MKRTLPLLLAATMLVACNELTVLPESPPAVPSSIAESSQPPPSIPQPEKSAVQAELIYLPDYEIENAEKMLSVVGEKSIINTNSYDYFRKGFYAIDEKIYFTAEETVKAESSYSDNSTISRLFEYNSLTGKYTALYQTTSKYLSIGCMLENGNLVLVGNDFNENSHGIYLYEAKTGAEKCIIKVNPDVAAIYDAALNHKTLKLYYRPFYHGENRTELYEYDLISGEYRIIAENAQNFAISENSMFYVADNELYRIDEAGVIHMTAVGNEKARSIYCHNQYVLMDYATEGITLIDTAKNTVVDVPFCVENNVLPSADDNGFILCGDLSEKYDGINFDCYFLDYSGNLYSAAKEYSTVLYVTDEKIFYREKLNRLEICAGDKEKFMAGLELVQG